MKRLWERFGDQVAFVDVLIRQAHPGPSVPPYRDFEAKMEDARRYVREEGIPWPVLVDDLEGTVHQTWGGLSDPAYLIDRDGKVSLYCLWTSPKALHDAIEALLAQGGVGVVHGGVRRMPELGPALTDGWDALQRGLPQSAVDMMIAMPLSPVLLWAAHELRPLLAPITLRERRLLDRRVRTGLAIGALALGAAAVLLRRRAQPASGRVARKVPFATR